MSETMTLENVTAQALTLRPVEKVRLVERLMNVLEQELAVRETPNVSLAAWHQVYADLPEEDIVEVERIVTDRSHFMRQEN
jgi:hypothetical protein